MLLIWQMDVKVEPVDIKERPIELETGPLLSDPLGVELRREEIEPVRLPEANSSSDIDIVSIVLNI
jgi:hypothetical protein